MKAFAVKWTYQIKRGRYNDNPGQQIRTYVDKVYPNAKIKAVEDFNLDVKDKDSSFQQDLQLW